MKRLLVLLICLIVFTQVYSQNNYIDNSLIFSSNRYGGTARFVGMSGAFGALGGDFSSIAINPAGIGVYRSSEFTFTPGLSYNKNESSYIGNDLKDDGYKFNVNNIGFVASYDLEDIDSRWVNFNIGIGFNRINDLNDNVVFQGINNSSLMEFYSEGARKASNPDGLTDDEYILWEAFILDYDSTLMEFYSDIDDAAYVLNGTEWVKNPDFEINQRKIIRTEGAVNNFNVTFGGNFAHKLYVGASIDIVHLRYEYYASHYEYETEGFSIPNIKGFEFIENSITSGTGFSLKLGAIYKPNNLLRLGGSVHIPVFYNLEKEYNNEAYGLFDDPSLDSYFGLDKQILKYKLQTPFRAMASVGLKISKIALLDIDYEYVDYSNLKLASDEFVNAFSGDNNDIKNFYQGVHNVRFGTELKFGVFYMRGGAAYSSSPYVNRSESYLFSYSGGLGFRKNNRFVDFAFSQSKMNYLMTPYNYGNDAVAEIDNTLNRFVLTFGVRF